MRKTIKKKDEEKEPKSFWETLPGILTALAALVTAIGGCVTAIVTWPKPNIFFPASLTPPILTSTPSMAKDPSAWPIILYDSFDDSKNWFTGYQNEPNYTASRLITNGKYRWETKALQDWFQWHHYSAAEVSDFYLTVEVKQVSGSINSSYGVIFRRDNADNFYWFRASDAQGFGLELQYDGKWENLIGWTKTSTIKPGAMNRLTVVAQGSHFRLYINNQHVGETDDSRLTRGKAGLTIEIDNIGDTVVLEFDNFELRAP